jgi:hypothetical protein
MIGRGSLRGRYEAEEKRSALTQQRDGEREKEEEGDQKKDNCSWPCLVVSQR